MKAIGRLEEKLLEAEEKTFRKQLPESVLFLLEIEGWLREKRKHGYSVKELARILNIMLQKHPEIREEYGIKLITSRAVERAFEIMKKRNKQKRKH